MTRPPHAPRSALSALLLLSLGLLATAGCRAEPEDRPDRSPPDDPSREITTEGAPEAIGPYSQAIRTGHALYLSGQIALNPETGELVEGGVEAETHQVMSNLRAVLHEAGMDFDAVVQTQVFLADLNDFAQMNEIYGSYLTEPFPARATVEVARLPRDARVEIMMIASPPGVGTPIR